MAVRKSQDVLRINVSQTDRQQSQLVEYLRKSGQITSQSMEAIKSYWYSYALASDPQASDVAVEMAAIESVIDLSACKEITSCIVKRLVAGMKDVIPLWTNPAVGQIHSCHLVITDSDFSGIMPFELSRFDR